ncbi:MAG: SDR family NAD(P)-dependent oxidoreductase [Acidimicrobiales bacterium]
MDLGLTGKRVLITGSYRGTGAGTARVFAAEGAQVLVHGREVGHAADVVAEIRRAGGAADEVAGDLSTDAGAQAMMASVEATFGSVDVLVANLGSPGASTWDSMDNWAQEWDANVLVGVRAVQGVMTSMRTQGWGRIVFIGTVGARRPGGRNPGYYGAKAGLHTIVRSLAKELRGSGVTANLVSPGMVATAEVRESLAAHAAKRGRSTEWADVEKRAVANLMPNLTERLPEPDDIGRLVAFVASVGAWHINGADLAIDGGALDA